MKRSVVCVLCMVVAVAGCSGNGDSKDQQDCGSCKDAVPAGDVVPDTANVPEIEEDVYTGEVDETPGCAGDFCAAGPDHAPDPSKWGPFPVGGTTMVVDGIDHEGHPRSFRVEIWYPTTEEFRDGPFEPVNIYEDAPEDLKQYVEKFKDAVPPIPIDVSRDTPVRRHDGPYPVVMFSHGAYGVRYQSVFFTVPLASHGYIVASIDHVDNTLYDIFAPDGYNLDDVVMSSFNRPYDSVAATTAVLVRNNKKGDPFYKTMIPDKLGFSGHSFGGFTSFLMGSIDLRIKAIIAMSPSTAWLGVIGYPLEEFKRPAMIMVGMLDNTLPPEVEQLPAYDKLNSSKMMMTFHTGGHYTFSDICQLDLEYVAKELGFGDAEDALTDGCGDFNIPVAVAHPLINQFGIGMFNYYLRDSPGSLKYFDAEAAEPWTEEFGYQIDLD